MTTEFYTNSWAIVIGINAYRIASPLSFARADAEAVAAALTERFAFDPTRVLRLYDADATAAGIRSALAQVAGPTVRSGDRVLVFFAGHGVTRTGRRGDVGFLVPVEGDPDNLATLLRWDELTRHADLIPAKHVLFVMDACYGGLAITRASQPGSMRFLRDMLKRASRQVLTAGKANETVSDAGGPRAGHSVFTGHLLDAFDGAAATKDGILTANAVMAYVYERVSRDPDSRQSPHYGYLDGDGDFVFIAPPLDALPDDTEKEVDILVDVPSSMTPMSPSATREVVQLAKEHLSDSRTRILLDDLVNEQLRRSLALLEPARFPLDGRTFDAATVEGRLSAYDEALGDLPRIAALVARWGQPEHVPTFVRIFERMADANTMAGGVEAWIGLRWMPFDTLAYCAGIGALSMGNYRMLAALYAARSADRASGRSAEPAFFRAVEGFANGSTSALIKLLPGHEKHLLPRSELQFKRIQPILDDLLFLGSSYEDLFDRFEILHALSFVHAKAGSGTGWGPPGRFAWKHRHYGESGPYHRLVQEFETAGEEWPPLKAGMFSGSVGTLRSTVAAFTPILARLAE